MHDARSIIVYQVTMNEITCRTRERHYLGCPQDAGMWVLTHHLTHQVDAHTYTFHTLTHIPILTCTHMHTYIYTYIYMYTRTYIHVHMIWWLPVGSFVIVSTVCGNYSLYMVIALMISPVCWNRWVFSFFLKVLIESSFLSSRGSLFQSLGAVYLKARLPYFVL